MSHPEHGPWLTPGLVARLCELYEAPELLTYGDIATQLSAEFNLSLTRFSIVGKIFRLKLPSRNVPAGRRTIADTRQQQPAEESITMTTEPSPEMIPEPDEPKSRSYTGYQRSIGQTSIDNLKSHHCKWPFGTWPDTTFCGKHRHDSAPYCKAHCKEAYHQ